MILADLKVSFALFSSVYYAKISYSKILGLITTSGMANSDYSRHEIFEVPFFHKCWHHSLPQELKDQFKRIFMTNK
jgi:hypothetical protein